MSSNWAVHFIGPDGRTRVGPWLLHDDHDNVRKLLSWGNTTAEEMEEHERNIQRWGFSTVVWHLDDRKLAQLIERGRGWPWNGYELKKMKEAGQYPPQALGA